MGDVGREDKRANEWINDEPARRPAVRPSVPRGREWRPRPSLYD